jgi:hypothetical protein
MDTENSNFVGDGDGDVGDDVGDNIDKLCAVSTQSIINNHVLALLYHLGFVEYKQHQLFPQQAVKQEILFPQAQAFTKASQS